MRRLHLARIAAWCLAGPVSILPCAAQQGPSATAEQRAVAYLSQQVPDWPRQNHCFSCHNNGDAARALYFARTLSHEVKPEVLEETTAWLLDPAAWDDPKGDPGFSDLKLARIQFAAALAEAFQTGAVRDPQVLLIAADRLLEDQETDGSWDVDVPGVLGSPATYGDALGTYMARRTLETAGISRFANAVAQADAWFLAAKPVATIEVGAVTLALADRLSRQAGPGNRADGEADAPAPLEPDSPAQAKHRELTGRIVATQNSDGGWGPYPKSPSEPFDTAVALLALQASASLSPGNRKAIEDAIQTGRKHLIERQLSAGGWPETTRPSGFQSYAQHISTSGWATLALLKTSNRKN
jgi:hypothetical protein